MQIVQSTVRSFGVEEVLLSQSLGRVMAKDGFADRDFPPYNRVTMDGIAIHFDAFQEGKRSFIIEDLCAAGMPQKSLKSKAACLEVMTGCIMPHGADTVIRYEDITIENGTASLNISQLTQGKNIHTKGLDQPKGTVVLPKGTTIGPAEIAIAASIGLSRIAVQKLPKTIVISTGDELINVEETPLPHQIRTSNVHTIQGCLQAWGLACERTHLNDDKAAIKTSLHMILNEYDLVILSGGVSKGKLDFIPEVLDSLGVKKHFHKVKQRPGKPFWFGEGETAVVFALPGNPVSSFMCTVKYVQAWLNQCTEKPISPKYARLSEEVVFRPDLTYFLPVALSHLDDGTVEAKPERGNGSGDLVGLSKADAFLELPAGKDVYQAGEVFEYISFL